jgi:hypothetical protein
LLDVFVARRQREDPGWLTRMKTLIEVLRADEEAVYQEANLTERGRVCERSPSLRARLDGAGLHGFIDAERVHQDAQERCFELTTPAALREYAAFIADRADSLVSDLLEAKQTIDKVRTKPLGRRPSAAMNWLIEGAATMGVTGPAVARRLAADGIIPEWCRPNDPDLVGRWETILKRARSRRRRRMGVTK